MYKCWLFYSVQKKKKKKSLENTSCNLSNSVRTSFKSIRTEKVREEKCQGEVSSQEKLQEQLKRSVKNDDDQKGDWEKKQTAQTAVY